MYEIFEILICRLLIALIPSLGLYNVNYAVRKV